jgi:phenylacetic acid degradation operon negative regulatory protein
VTDRIDTCLHTLIGRFRRQRPLRSGSLLVTILGDSIAPRGGRITLGSLICLAGPFGLPERLVRTSVARLAQQGWLAARRSGRTSEYRLTARGRRSFAAATLRIYGARPHAWDRRWTLILLPAPTYGGPSERLREELHWLGFGQFATGAWGHPGGRAADVRAHLTEAAVGKGAFLMQAVNAHLSDDRRLVESGWDLAELADAYRRFVAGFSPIRAALRSRRVLCPSTAFVLRTLLIHEYRKIHLRDPLLPDALLPKNWIGSAAYDLCRELYRCVFRAAERHLTSQARTLVGALPPASQQARGRFGGKGDRGVFSLTYTRACRGRGVRSGTRRLFKTEIGSRSMSIRAPYRKLLAARLWRREEPTY